MFASDPSGAEHREVTKKRRFEREWPQDSNTITTGRYLDSDSQEEEEAQLVAVCSLISHRWKWRHG